LMLAVLTVVGHLGPDQTRVAHQEAQVGPEQIVQLLSKDLARATSVVVDPQTGAVVLEGYGAVDTTSFVPTGRAARVTYQLLAAGGGQWLVRKQLPLDQAYSQPWIECVSPAVKKLTIVPQQSADASGGIANAGHGAGQSQLIGDGTAPFAYDRVRLQIRWTDVGRSPFDQVIVLR
jgi:hypothetical protein